MHLRFSYFLECELNAIDNLLEAYRNWLEITKRGDLWVKLTKLFSEIKGICYMNNTSSFQQMSQGMPMPGICIKTSYIYIRKYVNGYQRFLLLKRGVLDNSLLKCGAFMGSIYLDRTK